METREVPALGHRYEGGACAVCGAADPDYAAGDLADGSTGSDEEISTNKLAAEPSAELLAQTGDPAPALIAGAGLAAAACLAAGVAFRRRRSLRR